jgi:hypothetical protein
MPGAKVVVQFVDMNVGGRAGSTYLNNRYRPHLRVGDGEYVGVAFCGGDSSEPIRTGVCVSAEVSFVYAPNVDYAPLIAGSQFQVLEGKRIVGVGVVTELTP